MRFKAQIHNITTFTKFVASLAALRPIAWVRLNDREVRFTIIPEQGTQVWAVLSIDTIFETFSIQSAANNVINLEVPLAPLLRALKSALTAASVSIRLTKKAGVPLLSLTIVRSSLVGTSYSASTSTGDTNTHGHANTDHGKSTSLGTARERETIITQDVPIRVLGQHLVEGLHEPRCREPDVHIQFPPLVQIKAISDRFTRLALAARPTHSGMGNVGPKLEMNANMHGCLKLSIKTDAMSISSMWTGLQNPELDPTQMTGGKEGIQQHPSTLMKAVGSADGKSDQGWARVRIDGRDWGRVLSVGRLGGRVIACFCQDHALILYVYLPNDGDRGDSVLTYYVSSYSV